MIRTRIIGTGSYVPPDILTNDNLSEMVDTSDEWIRTRTGICNRHIAKDMDNADMAYNAARNAVEDARIEASKIGLIIVATSTPDYAFPNQASLVQAKLKAVNAMCFDVSAACSGFITALDIAASMLKAGSYKYALVIGSEKMSEIVNWKDRSVCVLFGDGAGAVVLKAVDNNTEDVTGALVGHERGIIDSNIYNDGTGASVLTGGRRFSDSCSTDIFIHMDGQEVFKFAVKSVPTAIETLLHNNNMDINEVAHQRDMALTMAQRRMVQQMPSVQKTKKSTKKKKKSWFQKHVSRTSSSLSTNQSQLIKVLVLIGIVCLCVLSVINFGLRAISNQKLATQEALRQEQLSKKEEETNKLASQRKKAKEAEALVVEKMSDETNAYQISNIQSDVKTLDLSITLPTKSKITVTKDDTVINDSSKVYTGTFTQSLELSENCTFEISIETYSDNSITVGGKEISFDKTGWQEGEPAVITLQIGEGNPNAKKEEYSQYDDNYYDYSNEYYAQGEDYNYGQDEYTEQTNDY